MLQEVVRHSLQMEHEAALRRFRQDMDEQQHRAKRDREELQEELRALQHDRDQSLLQAETEKQQVWSWYHDTLSLLLEGDIWCTCHHLSELLNCSFSGPFSKGGREGGVV